MPIALVACGGQQSALQPAGPGARDAAILGWAMFAASVVIFALVVVLLLYAVLQRPERRRPVSVDRMVVGGGIALPVVALSILLAFGLKMGSSTYAELPNDAQSVRIDGRQWWWKVEYLENGSMPSFTTANEIYLPVGESVELLLSSADVIHSFWVPRLAGKQDLIPGRVNRLVVEADEPGVFRAHCAEFCGLAHTQMALYVIAVDIGDQRSPAWAGAIVFLLVDAALFASLVYSYFYLWTVAEVWPPSGYRPILDVPALVGAVLLLACLPAAVAAQHGASSGRPGLALTGLALTIALFAAAVGAGFLAYVGLPFALDSNAYSAVVGSLALCLGLHILLALGAAAFAIARVLAVGMTREHSLAVRVAALFSFYTILQGVIVYAVFYLSPDVTG